MSVPIKEPGPSSPADVDALAPVWTRGRRSRPTWDATFARSSAGSAARGCRFTGNSTTSSGSVYAFRDEIDAWRAARSARPEEPRAENASGARSSPRLRVGLAPLSARRWRSASPSSSSPLGRLAQRAEERVSRSRPPEIRSIVVLPFENLSADPGQEFFAAGLTEEITARLAQLTKLRVVSRTSAMSLQGPEASGVGNRAGAGHRCRRGGQCPARSRAGAHFSPTDSCATDTHLWARDFEREAAPPGPCKSRSPRRSPMRFAFRRRPQERARLAAGPPVSAAAHEEYMLGRYLLWKFIEEDRVRAIEHFNRAIELQPEYAAPYAALAHAWWMRGVFGPLSLREVATPAREAALAALARDDGNVEAYAALAYVQGMFDWEWNRAQATIQRAVTLEPNNVDARYVRSLLLMALGRLDEAMTEIDDAVQAGPVVGPGPLDLRSGPLPCTPVRGGSRSPGAGSRARAAESEDVRSAGGGTGAIGALRQGARAGRQDGVAPRKSPRPFPLAAAANPCARRTNDGGPASWPRVPPHSPERAQVLVAVADHDAAFTLILERSRSARPGRCSSRGIRSSNRCTGIPDGRRCSAE